MIQEEFEKVYGKEQLDAVMEGAGKHTLIMGGNIPPESGDERLVFALLEEIDFECPKYGDSAFASCDEMREFLLPFRDAIQEMRFEPPSYVGLMAGAFDFLLKEKGGTA